MILERRLVGYLQEFQESGDPLAEYTVVAGHTSADRPMPHVAVTCTNAGGGLSYSGVDEVVVRVLVLTSADDEAFSVHEAAVAAVRAILSRALAITVSDELSDESFAVSGYVYEGSVEGRDETQRRHGTEETWRFWASVMG